MILNIFRCQVNRKRSIWPWRKCVSALCTVLVLEFNTIFTYRVVRGTIGALVRPHRRTPPLGAPFRGAGTALAVTEGSPVSEYRHLVKDPAMYRKPLSFRDQCSHWSWESVLLVTTLYMHMQRIGDTDCRVASLLATAAYLDSSICRLVPLGAMTGYFESGAPILILYIVHRQRDGTEAVPYDVGSAHHSPHIRIFSAICPVDLARKICYNVLGKRRSLFRNSTEVNVHG